MQEIDRLIDDQTQLAEELVRTKIRNQQAHDELQTYNDTQEFKYIHPLALQTRYSDIQTNELKTLLKENPEKFLNEITNTTQNIRRIRSDISKKKYRDEEQHRSWLENISRAETKLQIAKKLISL